MFLFADIQEIFKARRQSRAVMELREAVTLPVREMRHLYVLVQRTIMKVVYWLMFWITAWKAQLVDTMNRRLDMAGTGTKVEQWQDSIVSVQSWRALARAITLDVRKRVKLGGPAYDATLLALDGKERKLFEFQKGVRPLVVVFGSCT